MSLIPDPPFREYDSFPAEWRRATLADVATLSRRIFQPNNGDTLLPYVGLEHISPGNPRLSNWGSSADVQSSKNWFVPGQVLYGKLRPYLDKAVLPDFEGVCSTDILVLDPTDISTAEFLVYLLHTPDFVGHAIATTGGVNLPRTNWTSLADFVFPLPPLPEQRRIAAVLNAIQDAIAAQEDVIAAARAFKRSLMQRLFTYGPGREPAPTKETEIGEIPAYWGVERLKSLVRKKITDGTHVTPTYVQDGIPFLRISDIKADRIDWTSVKYISVEEHHELSKRCRPEPGDILLSKNGTVGRTKVVDWGQEFSIFVSLCLIKPDERIIDSHYLANYISSNGMPQVIERGKKMTVTNLHLVEINELQIPLPALDEQRAVSEAIHSIDAKIAAEEDRKTALAALFKSMLHQLMTGQIRLLSDEGLSL